MKIHVHVKLSAKQAKYFALKIPCLYSVLYNVILLVNVFCRKMTDGRKAKGEEL